MQKKTKLRKFTPRDHRNCLKRLRAHIRVHKDTDISWEDDPELAGWIKYTRQKLHEFEPKHLNELIEAGFFTKQEKAWLKMFHKLRIFQETMGHCRVPARWEKNAKLSRWFHKQRTRFSEDRLPDYQLKLLESIGFETRIHNYQPHLSWDERFEQLVKYQKRFGNCEVPAKWPENQGLGNWVSVQRQYSENLNRSQRKKLNDLGFSWAPKEELWEQHYQELRAFKKKHGHCRVPNHFRDNPSLAIWVSNTRRRTHCLSSVQKRKLDRLGFDWNPDDTLWNEQFDKLVRYKKKYGDTLVPARWPENPTLAGWVVQQRTNRQNISDERREKLESIDFVWDVNTWIWEQRFSELVEFKKRFGHCHVPVKNWPENPKLDGWLQRQRGNWKELQKERRERLKKLGVTPQLPKRR